MTAVVKAPTLLVGKEGKAPTFPNRGKGAVIAPKVTEGKDDTHFHGLKVFFIEIDMLSILRGTLQTN